MSGVVVTARQHGTYVKYVQDRCRCEDCRAAQRRYERDRAGRIAPPYVDAEPARRHVKFLGEHGVGLKQVAKVSGVAHGTLWKLVYGVPGRGPSKRVRPSTESALLAVQPNAVADGAKVDARPTWKLIDEMVAAGVPRVRIAEAIGQTCSLQLSRKLIWAGHARSIARLHADWHAGRVKLTRTHSRWGSVVVAPPDPLELDRRERSAASSRRSRDRLAGLPEPDDDVSDLFDTLAEIVRLRAGQPWRSEAACRGRPTWMWFPSAADTETIAAAVKVCGSCTVRRQCRGEMFDEPEGIYAGITPGERRQIATAP